MFANNAKKKRQQMTRRNSTKKSYRSDNYRAEYFRKNPGLFGKIHFCYYCGKPLTKKYVEVDHILPVSKSRVNSTFNLAASCRKCNRSKSDKINHLVAVGYGRKIVGNVLSIPFRVAGVALSGFFKLGSQMKFFIVCIIILGYFYVTSGS